MIEIIVTACSSGNIRDRAEAETVEAACIAARTLVSDHTSQGSLRVSFYLDGKLLMHNVHPSSIPYTRKSA